jgi:TolB protein
MSISTAATAATATMAAFTRRRAFATTLLGTTAAATALAACGGANFPDPTQGFAAADGAAPIGDDGAVNPAALPGKLLYVGDANVWVWEKGAVKKLTDDRISRQPQWSPDGKKIALVKIAVNSSEIWTMDADSANSRQLTRNANTILANNNWAFRPTWWPDGSKLLYLSEEFSNDLMLWQLSLDGRSHQRFLSVPDLEGGLDMPSLSADAKRLVVVSYRGPGLRSNVWTYGLPNGPWRQITESAEGAYDPTISPDGARIAYTIRTKGTHDVWVMGVDGADPQPVTQNGTSRAPCWSPDGQVLAFCSAETGAFEMWVAPAPPAAPPVAPAAGTATGTGAPSRPESKLPAARQLTRGAQIDATSGLSWTR